MVFSTSINFTVTGASCPSSASFLDVIYNLPTCIVENFFTSLINGFIYSANQFLSNSLTFIITGPNLNLFCSPYSQVMGILESLYTLALMGVGAYYIATAADIQKRANAKRWIQNILLVIVVLAVSFNIFQMIIELNQYVTTSIYSTALSSLLDIRMSFTSFIFAFILSFNFIAAAGLTFSTLLTRYLMIPFLLLLFPIAIFLYFIPFTKEWGKFLLKFILLIIFMTSIDAILISGLSYLFSIGDPVLSSGFIQGMALMFGFGLIGFVNLLIYIIATFSFLESAFGFFKDITSFGWQIAMLLALL